jgi:hypothetical protein
MKPAATTEQIGPAAQMPPQRPKTESPIGCADSVTSVPSGTSIAQVPGQSMPSGLEVTRPLPHPPMVTETWTKGLGKPVPASPGGAAAVPASGPAVATLPASGCAGGGAAGGLTGAAGVSGLVAAARSMALPAHAVHSNKANPIEFNPRIGCPPPSPKLYTRASEGNATRFTH